MSGRRPVGSPMPVATTDTALDSSAAKPVRSASATCRLAAPAGSTRSSGSPNLTPRNGVPSSSRKATTTTAIGSGRRITPVASRCQKPPPEGSGEPQGGAPADRAGSGEPQGGAPADRAGSGEPQGGAPADRAGSGEPQGGAPADRAGSGEPQGGAPVG